MSSEVTKQGPADMLIEELPGSLQRLSFPSLFPEALAFLSLGGSLLRRDLASCWRCGTEGCCQGRCLLQVTWHLISPAPISSLPLLADLLEQK